METITHFIGILTITLFGVSTVLYKRNSAYARIITTVSLLSFSAFWVSLFPYLVFQTRSFVYGITILTGVPITVYIAYQYYRIPEQYTTMPKLIQFLFIASLVYAPLELSTTVRQEAIELVAYQTYQTLTTIGIEVELIHGEEYGYLSTLAFPHPNGSGQLITHIEPACTGLGSMAVIIGLITISSFSKVKTLLAIMLSVFIIHILNIIRNVFIAASFGRQWLQVYPDQLQSFLALEYESLVSFFIADKVIAQLLSAAVLFAFIYGLTITSPQFKQFITTLTDEWIPFKSVSKTEQVAPVEASD